MCLEAASAREHCESLSLQAEILLRQSEELQDVLVLARGEQAAASPRAGSVRLDANESDDPAAAARAKMIAHLEGRV